MTNAFSRRHPGWPVRLAVALTITASCCAMAAEGDNALVLGTGLAASPRYSGSNQLSVGPLLIIDYSMANGFFASSLRGLGYGGQVGALGYSASLGIRGGRKEKNQIVTFGNGGSDRLQGMGEIKSDVDAVLAVTYMPLEGVQLGLSAAAPVNQASNGRNMHASVSWQLYGQGNNRLELGMTAGFADKKYGQTYYGVTAQQAARSRFHPFVPGAGWYEAGVALTWDHKFNAQWGVTSMLGATQLLQQAARSPLTERKTSPTIAVYASYHY